MNFLVIKGQSSYGILRRFSDEAAQSLRKLGHKVEVYDVYDRTKVERPLWQIQELFDAILCFNGMGSENNTEDDGQTKPIFEVIGRPFLSWMVDHPAYHFQRLNAGITQRISLYANQEHCELARLAGFDGTHKILLAGAMGDETEPKPFDERKNHATLAATWMGEPSSFWEDSYDPSLAKMVREAIDILIDDVQASPFSALSTIALKNGFDIKPGPQFFTILCQMLNFIRSLDRIRIIQSLAKSGLPVSIVGSGWDRYCGPRGNLQFLPDKSTDEMIEIYRDSKVIINLNAANGASERAFTGMLAGGAVLSDFGSSLANTANNNEEIMFFDRSQPGDIATKLGTLLESNAGEKIATKGRECTLKKHLWSHRIDQLLDYLDEKNTENKICLEGT